MEQNQLIIGWYYKDTPLIGIDGHLIGLAGYDEDTGAYDGCFEVSPDDHNQIVREQLSVAPVNEFTSEGLYELTGYEVKDWGQIAEPVAEEKQERRSAADYLRDAQEKAADSVGQVYRDPEAYANFLRFMARFPEYTAENCALVYAQNPHAERLKTFRAWKQDKRQVRRGEKGLDTIWKNESTLKVFDISQTEGKSIREEEILPPLSYETLKAVCKRTFDYDVEERNVQKSHSFSDFSKKKIFVRKDMGETEKMHAILYQLAFIHIKSPRQLHNENESKSIRAVRAESAAVVVAHALRIPKNDQVNFEYIPAMWQDESMHNLLRNLESVQITAKNLYQQIDRNYRALQKETKAKKFLENLDRVDQQIQAQREQEQAVKAQEKDYYRESLRDDNEIDLDRERTRDALGFRDYNEQLEYTAKAVYQVELTYEENPDREKIKEDLKCGQYLNYLRVYESFLAVADEKNQLSALENTPYYYHLKEAILSLKSFHNENMERLNTYMSITVPPHLVTKLFQEEVHLEVPADIRMTKFENGEPVLRAGNVAEVIGRIEQYQEITKELGYSYEVKEIKGTDKKPATPLAEKIKTAQAKAQEFNIAREKKTDKPAFKHSVLGGD